MPVIARNKSQSPRIIRQRRRYRRVSPGTQDGWLNRLLQQLVEVIDIYDEQGSLCVEAPDGSVEFFAKSPECLQITLRNPYVTLGHAEIFAEVLRRWCKVGLWIDDERGNALILVTY